MRCVAMLGFAVYVNFGYGVGRRLYYASVCLTNLYIWKSKQARALQNFFFPSRRVASCIASSHKGKLKKKEGYSSLNNHRSSSH